MNTLKNIFLLFSILILNSCTAQSDKQRNSNDSKTESNTSQSKKAAMRPLTDLINKTESAWPSLLQWKDTASNKIEFLPKDQKKADSALYYSQVTTRSPMGAIVYETGGILIDGGWIRILGSGHDKLNRSLMEWNKGKSWNETGKPLPYLLIADDVLGGFFAINAGGIEPSNTGKVYYLAPDTWKWENLNLSYSDFIWFCFSGNIKEFYANLRWKGWENDLKNINGNQGVFCFPYLTTKEGNDINKVERKNVPIQELWDLMISN